VASDEGRPQRVEKIVGRVTRGRAGAGSKSERDAVWLETPDARLLLRRKDGPTYADRSLDQHVGKEVECDGFQIGDLLLAERITPTSTASNPPRRQS
jgi:hypothetical protein